MLPRFASQPGRLAALALTLCALPAPVLASGLQVEPVTVTLRERSGIIWLTNSGSEPIQAQVRTYRWSQGPQGETLDPSEDLIASPPMVRIPAGGRQVVRLVSSGAASCEDTYRLKIDELPGQTPATSGLRYVLHYSVPVFVTRRECAQAAPNLSWRLVPASRGIQLQVENSGTAHAQLAQASFVKRDGHRIELSPGLMGYVLPGSRMDFTLAPPPEAFDGGGTLELLVNGKRVTQSLPAG